MSFVSKLSAGLFAASCVCSLAAAEILNINAPADFMTPKQVAVSEDGIIVKGPSFNLFSAKMLKLDPAKKYKISGDFRLKEGEKVDYVYLGFVPFDAQGKKISSGSVNVTPNSDTILVKAAVAGDTVVYVKDASTWDNKTPHGYFVFNANPDYSDLPNFNLLQIPQGGIEQDGDVWKITLKKPLKKDIAEGVGVRQQKAGSAYIYASYKRDLPHEWTTLSGIISGSVAKSGNPSKKLWPATASVRLMVMMLNGDNNCVVEMKNIKIEEIE